MIEQRIQALGESVPEAPSPLASYVPAVKTGKLILTAGQIPLKDGKLRYSGKVGKDLSVEDAKEAAKICALNCLSVIKSICFDLDKINRVVKLVVFVNSENGFTDQPKVANGASDFLVEVFGEKGKHARSAVGVNELPINAAVEIEMMVEVTE